MPVRRKKKKKIETRGREPLKETIKASWLEKDGRSIRFTISEDMAKQLVDLHQKAFGIFYYNELIRARFDPTKMIRIEVMRLDELGLSSIYMRCEPPTFNPQGHKLWQAKTGRRYFTQFRAKPLGIKEGMPPVTLEMLFDPNQGRSMGGGIILTFPDHYMTKDLT